jgi:hypothetical protein
VRTLDLGQLERVPTPVRVSTSFARIIVGFEPRMQVAGRLVSPVPECEWVCENVWVSLRDGFGWTFKGKDVDKLCNK